MLRTYFQFACTATRYGQTTARTDFAIERGWLFSIGNCATHQHDTQYSERHAFSIPQRQSKKKETLVILWREYIRSWLERFDKNFRRAIMGRSHFPLHLIFLEFAGGLLGPIAMVRLFEAE